MAVQARNPSSGARNDVRPYTDDAPGELALNNNTRNLRNRSRNRSINKHDDSAIRDSEGQPASVQASSCALTRILNHLRLALPIAYRPSLHQRFTALPSPSPSRLQDSLAESPFDLASFQDNSSELAAASEKGRTVLYLAYGSNLCAETFRGKRGIKPLARVNVHVPELELRFDLRGIPYSEPCFANVGFRDENGDCATKMKGEGAGAQHSDSHEEDTGNSGFEETVGLAVEKTDDLPAERKWTKGLVGCVWEVTPTDYAHIIATEGGGASYKDILVTCYPLADGIRTTPSTPSSPPFKAHTLFAPVSAMQSRPRASTTSIPAKAAKLLGQETKAGITREKRAGYTPYAQPSPRYLNLITTGSSELSLPHDYHTYLTSLHPYRITTRRQEIGKALFLGIWGPVLALLFALMERLQGENGKAPDWVVWLAGAVFKAVWAMYDGGWKRVFGDGERTEGDDVDAVDDDYDGGDGGWRKMCWWRGEDMV